jgi:transposase
MEPMYYIGLDVHKRKISYCVKDSSGAIHSEGLLSATRLDLDLWMKTLPQPWSAAMEATMFTGWIYDHLQPHAATLKVAHPLMLRAIAAAKKKNDRIDARKICDCLRCDFLPESSRRKYRRRQYCPASGFAWSGASLRSHADGCLLKRPTPKEKALATADLVRETALIGTS